MRNALAGWLFLALLAPHPSRAVDGVIEINQQAVLAAGGFPFQIFTPGSYRLTSNLDLRGIADAQNLNAITANVGDVSIDLNGFAIIGPTVCPGISVAEPLACAPTGSGRGISAQSSRVSVSNGVVRGVGLFGIACGGDCRIERVKVENCGSIGIQVGNGSILLANTVRGNGGIGIVSGANSVIRENTVSNNGGAGLTSESASVIANNTVHFNRGLGMSIGATSTVVANSITQNIGDGILASSANIVRDNAIFLNGGYGINFQGGTSSGYVNNVLSANTLGNVTSGTQLGGNICGSALCP